MIFASAKQQQNTKHCFISKQRSILQAVQLQIYLKSHLRSHKLFNTSFFLDTDCLEEIQMLCPSIHCLNWKISTNSRANPNWTRWMQLIAWQHDSSEHGKKGKLADTTPYFSNDWKHTLLFCAIFWRKCRVIPRYWVSKSQLVCLSRLRMFMLCAQYLVEKFLLQRFVMINDT